MKNRDERRHKDGTIRTTGKSGMILSGEYDRMNRRLDILTKRGWRIALIRNETDSLPLPNRENIVPGRCVIVLRPPRTGA